MTHAEVKLWGSTVAAVQRDAIRARIEEAIIL